MRTPNHSDTTKPSTATVTILLALAMVTFSIAGAMSTLVTDDPLWSNTAKLTPHPLDFEADFGATLALNEDTIIIGAPGTQTVHIYQQEAEALWLETQTLQAPANTPTTLYGATVAANDEMLLVANTHPPNAGVFQYEKTPTGYEHAHTFTTNEPLDLFGESLAIHEDTIAIGAPLTDQPDAPKAGAIHVYEATDDAWEKTTLTLQDPQPSDTLGRSVDVHHDTIAAAANGQGAAHVFEHDDDTWQHTATLANTGYARTIALVQDMLAVGHPSERSAVNTFYGSVTIHERTTEGWTDTARILPHDLAPYEDRVRFGQSLDFNEDATLLAIGAPDEDATPSTQSPTPKERDPVCRQAGSSPHCSQPGAVYLYEPDQDAWSQTAKLTPPEEPPAYPSIEGSPPQFGESLDVDDQTLLIGAPSTDQIPQRDVGATHLYQALSEVPS